jgi:hypothetical protein
MQNAAPAIRPTIELMPSININELRHVIPRHPALPACASLLATSKSRAATATFNASVSYGSGRAWEYPARSSCAPAAMVPFDYSPAMAIMLAAICHRAVYASQKNNQFARPRLQASKLRLKLGGWPDIIEPLPPKPKWKHHKRYQKLRNQIQELEAQAKQTRFRKPIPTQLFAYHVS